MVNYLYGLEKLCYHHGVEKEGMVRQFLKRLRIVLIALSELGPWQLIYYALYRLGLHSGLFRYLLPAHAKSLIDSCGCPLAVLMPAPKQADLLYVLRDEGKNMLMAEADKVIAGQVRLFGGSFLPLELIPPQPLLHWTDYELRGERQSQKDVKIIWEPARMGWAILLARAYTVSGNERYAETFWNFLEDFLDANPPYEGWNWVSAQEVGIRLLALALCWNVFVGSAHSTKERQEMLAKTVAWHAKRIPPTMVYARAQNNNHLLSEAAGLFTAGLMLPGHPKAAAWREIGWRWFQRGICAQISQDGLYIQHSTNYHRLMLQLALWMESFGRQSGRSFSAKVKDRLAAATNWLLALLDEPSGRVPNLGPNDGAYIFPLSNLPSDDFRPVLQSSACAFLGRRAFNQGLWDEMPLWFGFSPLREDIESDKSYNFETENKDLRQPVVLESTEHHSWAFLRAVRFTGRPGHADQLHVDLWWKGLNIACDAGTYLYNAPSPWDNALTRSDVHNSVTVDEQEQMLRAGCFLYLRRAQARLLTCEPHSGAKSCITAQHDGYRRLGVTHCRSVSLLQSGWLVEDEVFCNSPKGASTLHTTNLHWLIPDWPWEIDQSDCDYLLKITSPAGVIKLRLQAWSGSNASSYLDPKIQIVRAGELVFGMGSVKPTWGWISNHYNEKAPALSVRVIQGGGCPLKYKSMWEFD